MTVPDSSSKKFPFLTAFTVLLIVAGAATVVWMWTVQPSADDLRQALFAEIQPVKLANCEFERFGESSDGGYVMCTNLLEGVDSAYSYGISGYDEWGCDMSRRLSATTHEYDCFNTKEPDCGGVLRFHAECVGPTRSTKDGRVFDSIENQLRANGDADKRLVVKMDIEGDEWDTLASTPESVLTRINQLAVEFHDLDQPRFLATIRRLKQHFHVVNVHFNNWVCDQEAGPFPARAFEVLFVNKSVGIVDPAGRPQVPHPLDGPNNPKLPDCQTTAQ